MAIRVQFQKFWILLQKDEWLFGYNCKILFFALKKRMAAWLHALSLILELATYLLD